MTNISADFIVTSKIEAGFWPPATNLYLLIKMMQHCSYYDGAVDMKLASRDNLYGFKYWEIFTGCETFGETEEMANWCAEQFGSIMFGSIHRLSNQDIDKWTRTKLLHSYSGCDIIFQFTDYENALMFLFRWDNQFEIN